MADMKKCTSFGIKMKIALVERGMTNQDLARTIGYTNSTISDVMYGRNNSRATMALIGDTLGIELGDEDMGV